MTSGYGPPLSTQSQAAASRDLWGWRGRMVASKARANTSSALHAPASARQRDAARLSTTEIGNTEEIRDLTRRERGQLRSDIQIPIPGGDLSGKGGTGKRFRSIGRESRALRDTAT